MRTAHSLASLATATLLALAACGSGDATPATDPGATATDLPAGDVPEDVLAPDAPTPADPGAAADPGVHATTSATPLVASAVLTGDHPGWKRADCLACHEVRHGGTNPAECYVCHGGNGAPLRKASHSNGKCQGCHPGQHDGANIPTPAGCTSCHKYATSVGCPYTQEVDAVVIGAGGGGLAAAAALAKGGLKVALLERHNKVGGYMTNFRRGDYRIEVSLHAMGGLDEGGDTRTTFTELGILDRVKPVREDKKVYRTVYPDLVYDTPADPVVYEQELKDMFPAEAEGIAKLFQSARDLRVVYKAAVKHLSGDSADMNKLLAEQPALVAEFMDYMNNPLSVMLARFIQDPKLVTIFTQISGYAGDPPATLDAMLFMLMWGSYHYTGYYNFEGGSQSISDALADVIRENGGDVRLDTLATRIVVEDGRAVEVRTQHDACYKTRWVVSNANVPATIDMIGRENLPEGYLAQVDSFKVGIPVFVLYLGVNGDFRAPFGDAREIILQDEWDPDWFMGAIGACNPEESILYITNYSTFDPTAAPAGKNVITITGALGDACWNDWNWNDYEQFKVLKDEIALRTLARVEKVVPGVTKAIEVLDVAAPQTLRAFTLNPRGTIFGYDETVEQSILNRIEQSTPIPNVYLAGAWTFPGPGQETVLVSGLTAAKAILKAEAAARTR